MRLIILAAILAITTTTCFAEGTNATNNPTSSTRHFPVILDNQVIANGVCRLYFDDGTSQDVACDRKNKKDNGLTDASLAALEQNPGPL